MRYNLAAMARRGTNRASLTLRPIEMPATLAAPLRKVANEIVTAIRDEVRAKLLPVYDPRPMTADGLTLDGVWDTIAGGIQAVKLMGNRLETTIDPAVAEWAVRIERWHRNRWAANVRAGTGADVSAMLFSEDAEEHVQSAMRWASSLIRDVDQRLLTTLENKTWAAFNAQVPRQELAKQIAADLGISRRRAELIAIDQSTKLASNLDQLRQVEAGIEEYRWIHSDKLHPRWHHVARNGDTFRWDDPPEDGHPGQAIHCGCQSMPILKLD